MAVSLTPKLPSAPSNAKTRAVCPETKSTLSTEATSSGSKNGIEESATPLRSKRSARLPGER